MSQMLHGTCIDSILHFFFSLNLTTLGLGSLLALPKRSGLMRPMWVRLVPEVDLGWTILYKSRDLPLRGSKCFQQSHILLGAGVREASGGRPGALLASTTPVTSPGS